MKLNKTLEKAFISKILELCKTRAKKSSSDLFNFYVDLAGHNKVTDFGGATMCRRNLKTPLLQTKGTKNEGHSEYMDFDEKK